jgi:hypothetical protein
MCLRQQRGGAGDEQPHVLAGFPVQARVGQQAGVEGRDAHEDGGARQQAEDLLHVELRQEQHRRAVQQHAVGRDEQPVGVEDRQGVQQHVVRLPAPIAVQRQHV